MRKNMTLVELIVVLAIMAAVASVAVFSLDSMYDDSRYSETARRADLLVAQVNGDNGGNPGRFIADMGRLPHVISNLQSANMAELFYSSGNIASFDASILFDNRTFSNPTTDWGGITGAGSFNFSSSVTNLILPCGWRGPYMIVSGDSFYDGWGNKWEVRKSSNNSWIGTMSWTGTSSFGDTVFGLRTLGKNAQVDVETTEWYNSDREFRFERNSSVADLNIQIMYLDDSTSPTTPSPVISAYMNYIRVAVFAPYITPDSNIADNIKRILAINDNGVESIKISPAEDPGYPHEEDDTAADWVGFYSVTLHNLAPGPRRLYVYGFKNSSGSTNKYGSYLLLLNLRPGQNSITVYLRETL